MATTRSYDIARRRLFNKYKPRFREIYEEIQKGMSIPAHRDDPRQYKYLKDKARSLALCQLCREYRYELNELHRGAERQGYAE